MKTIIGIATFNRKEYLKKTINSLSGQADKIYVYDNNIEHLDLKDFGKFFFLQKYSEPIYYFSCDDDIIYPPTYVKDTINAIEKYKSIVTYHSESLSYKNEFEYPDIIWNLFGQNINSEIYADIMGTGVTAFRTDYFNPLEVLNMIDVGSADHALSYLAHKQNKSIIHVPHSSTYLIDQEVPLDETMYGKFGRFTKNQIFMANEILKLKIINSVNKLKINSTEEKI
jgi:hypothetical protein